MKKYNGYNRYPIYGGEQTELCRHNLDSAGDVPAVPNHYLISRLGKANL